MNAAIKWFQLLLISLCLVMAGCSDDDDDDGGSNNGGNNGGNGFSDPHGGVQAPEKLDRPAASASGPTGYNLFFFNNEMDGDGSSGGYETEMLLGSFDLTIGDDGAGTFDVTVTNEAEQELFFSGPTTVEFYFYEASANPEMESLPANAYADGSFSVFIEGEVDEFDRELNELLVFDPINGAGDTFIGASIYHNDYLDNGEIVGAEIGANFGFAAEKAAIVPADLNRDYGFLVYSYGFTESGYMEVATAIGRMHDIDGDGVFCLGQQTGFDAFDYGIDREADTSISHFTEQGPSCAGDPELSATITPVGGTGSLTVTITEHDEGGEGIDETEPLGFGGFAAPGSSLIVADQTEAECVADVASPLCGIQGALDSELGFFLAVPLADGALNLTGSSYTLRHYSTFYGDPQTSDPYVDYDICTGTQLHFADASTVGLEFPTDSFCSDVTKDNNVDVPGQELEAGDGTSENASYTTTGGADGGAISITLENGLKAEGFVSADGELMILLISGEIEGEEVEATWLIGTRNPG